MGSGRQAGRDVAYDPALQEGVFVDFCRLEEPQVFRRSSPVPLPVQGTSARTRSALAAESGGK
ncbi:hypothetical protein ACQ86N_38410 [Puia sp. P3]|uniref:hypothetical protein n=1 Tax=Puia sp. P3 TaxID=3423952 RepID=UPI003D664AA8